MSGKLVFEIEWSEEFATNPAKNLTIKVLRKQLRKGIEKQLRTLDSKCVVKVFEK